MGWITCILEIVFGYYGRKRPVCAEEVAGQDREKASGSKEAYTLVGDAFVYGFMDGEVVKSGAERLQPAHIY